MNIYTYDELHHIFVEVSQGRNNYGGFLRSFAEAFNRADDENAHLLKFAASKIVEKYNLSKYLDNYKKEVI